MAAPVAIVENVSGSRVVSSTDWEEYGGGRFPETAARATIRRDRRISLNQAAYDLLGQPAAVALLYSMSRRAIGLRAAGQDTVRRFPVRTWGKEGAYIIGA